MRRSVAVLGAMLCLMTVGSSGSPAQPRGMRVVEAWKKFQESFAEDNPYAQEDQEMRQQAAGEIERLQAEVKTPDPKAGEITVTLPGGATMEMVWIEPGTFMMGSPDSDDWAYSYEKPQHRVTISEGFYLGKYELTEGQWAFETGSLVIALGNAYEVDGPMKPERWSSRFGT